MSIASELSSLINGFQELQDQVEELLDDDFLVLYRMGGRLYYDNILREVIRPSYGNDLISKELYRRHEMMIWESFAEGYLTDTDDEYDDDDDEYDSNDLSGHLIGEEGNDDGRYTRH